MNDKADEKRRLKAAMKRKFDAEVEAEAERLKEAGELGPECKCDQIDLLQFGGSVSLARWRDLSLQDKVCGIAACACAPFRKCGSCDISYCLHHGESHFHFGRPVEFKLVKETQVTKMTVADERVALAYEHVRALEAEELLRKIAVSDDPTMAQLRTEAIRYTSQLGRALGHKLEVLAESGPRTLAEELKLVVEGLEPEADPNTAVEAVVTLAALVTAPDRETSGLVREAMQPWADSVVE